MLGLLGAPNSTFVNGKGTGILRIVGCVPLTWDMLRRL